MATYSQTPGLLNIKGVVGSHFSCQLDFDTSLSGYTFDSAIVLQEYPTKREQPITVAVNNAGSGIITLSLTGIQTSSVGAIANKKWYLNWTIGGIKQTILAGRFELSDIPLGQNIVTSTGVTINTQSVDITLSAFSNAALDGKQPLDSDLTAIAGLSPNDNDFIQRKSGSWTNRSIPQVKTDLALNNVDNTSDLNKPISTATQSVLNNKLDSTLASGVYQPLDSDLTSIAGITPSNDDIIQRKAGVWVNRSLLEYKTDLALNNVDNTSDANKPVSSATQTVLNNKLDATLASSTYQPLDSDLTSISNLAPSNDDFIQRKAGVWQNRTILEVKTDFGISNVDNTSDADKPISTATQSALNNKLDATLASASYQPLDGDLTSIAGITPNDDDIIQRKSGVWINRSPFQYKSDLLLNNVDNTSDANKPLSNAAISALSYKVNTSQISTFGYSLVNDADASEARSTLGLGTMAQQNTDSVNITGGNAVLSNPLGLASGGTNASLSPTNGGVVYSTATNFAVSSVGTNGQVLISSGTGAPSWSSLNNLQVGTAAEIIVANNNTTNREFFPVFAYQTGLGSQLYGSNSKLKFNPSNGYLTANGFNTTDIGVYGAGIHWSNSIVLDAEQGFINDGNGNTVASWSSGTGEMYVYGTASYDVPLQITDGAERISTGAYIIVRPQASSFENGTSLRNAYAAAKAFAPNSLALSATNRATVILLPGRYDLGTTRLNLDTDFVDIIGLTDTPEQVVITSSVILSDSGTVYQTANDVKIKGVTIDRTGSPAGSGAGRTAAYFPFPKATAITAWSGDGTTMTIAANGHGLQTGDSVRISGSGNSSVDGVFTVTRIDDNSFSYPSTVNAAGSIGTATERFNLTYIENCVFSGTSDSGMRRATEYAGTYRKCVGGAASFGCMSSFSSGLFEDCVATSDSFAGLAGTGSAEATGTFRRCVATSSSFGIKFASGLFEDCTATIESFGGYPGGSYNATGTFRRCTGPSDCFGFLTASGTFENCVVTSGHGFGSRSGMTATGTFTECLLTNNNSYAGTFTGTMRRCRFVCTGTNNNALNVGAGAKIFDSTLVATGTGNSITAGSAVTISLAGCRMNNSINSNVSNNLGTLTESYNLIDSDIS
jgi:hypothetical protein